MNLENNEIEKIYYDNNIEKKLYVESDLPWVRYLVIDEMSFKRKLVDNVPKNIKEEYFKYIVNSLIHTISTLTTGDEVSINSLIKTSRGISTYIFTEEDEKEIANLFFSKCKDYEIKLEMKYANGEYKSIFNIPFTIL